MFKFRVLLTFLVTAMFVPHAQAKEPISGIDYTVLSPSWEQSEKLDKPVVYEFFGYLCPGCNYFQQTMHTIEKDNDFELIRVPVVFHATWEPYARAYHALQLMGKNEDTHAAIFNAAHQQGKKWRNTEQIGEWLAANHGIDAAEFVKMCHSFAVENMMKKAEKMRQHMQVANTPTLVVDGKYKAKFKDLSKQEKNIGITSYLLNL